MSLDEWEYRKSHTIKPGPGAGTNYQMKFRVWYNGFDKTKLIGQSVQFDQPLKILGFTSDGTLWGWGDMTATNGEPTALFKSVDEGKNWTFVFTVPESGKVICGPGYIVQNVPWKDRILFSSQRHPAGDLNRMWYYDPGSADPVRIMNVGGASDRSCWNYDEYDNQLFGGAYEWRVPVTEHDRVYRSLDGGVNWTDISDPNWLVEDHIHIQNLRVDPSNGWLYAAMHAGPSGGALWRSKLRDGSDWVKKVITPPSPNDNAFIGIVFKDGWVYCGHDTWDGYNVSRFQDDGTGNSQVPVVVLQSNFGEPTYYMEKDPTGRIWCGIHDDSPATHNQARLYTSDDGTNWSLIDWAGMMQFALQSFMLQRNFRAGISEIWATFTDGYGGPSVVRRYSLDNNVDLHGHCQLDFKDIRFAGDDLTLLDYWIESKVDGSYADVWVEIKDDLSSGEVLIYIYYGNPGAVSESNGTNTFLFFDDFDDLSKWTRIATGGSSTCSGSVLTVQSITGKETIQANDFVQCFGRMRYRFKRSYWDVASPVRDLGFLGWGEGDTVTNDVVNFRSYIGYLSRCYQLCCRKNGSAASVQTTGPQTYWMNFRTAELLWVSSKARLSSDDMISNEDQLLVESNSARVPSVEIAPRVSVHQNDLDMTLSLDWLFCSKLVPIEPYHWTWGSEEEALGEKNLSCSAYILKVSGEDWSKYLILAFAYRGEGPGGTFLFRIRNYNNFRYGTVEDNLPVFKVHESRFRLLDGTPNFDWKNVTGLEFEADTLGDFEIDSIWLLGCPWLKCSLIVRNKTSKNLSCSAILQRSKNLGASFTIPPFKDLSSNVLIRGSATKNLSNEFSLVNQGAKDLECEVEILGFHAPDLPVSVTIRKAGSAQLSINCQILYPGTIVLSLSCGIAQFIRFSCNLRIRRPLGYADVSSLGPELSSEVI